MSLFLRNSGRKTDHTFPGIALEPDISGRIDLKSESGSKSKRYSMMSAENRFTLFGIKQ
jgi:hypothetical protein